MLFAVDHSDVNLILSRVPKRWNDIGKELQIPETSLRALQECHLPPEICSSKMIEDWLMYSGAEPSWNCLSEALKKINIEYNIVAELIMSTWGELKLMLL